MPASADYVPLAIPVDLADFPGAPFPDSIVRAAGESVRSEAGWHIAPEVTETLRIFSEGGTALLLPSLKVSAVTEVRDVSEATPVVLAEWTDRGSGILLGRWPANRMIEVDVTHGYPTCPPELLPVIAHRAQAARTAGGNVRLGSLSIGGDTGPSEQDVAVVRRFSLR